jgi:hypothetical protein
VLYVLCLFLPKLDVFLSERFRTPGRFCSILEGSLACFSRGSIVGSFVPDKLHSFLPDTSGCLVVVSLQMGGFRKVKKFRAGPRSGFNNIHLVETPFEFCGVAKRGERKELNQYNFSANGRFSSGH